MRPFHHPLFDRLEGALRDIVPRMPVQLRGAWSRHPRRTYASAAQAGTGAGPFVDVIDGRWCGTLACDTSITAVAFLVTTDGLWWVKAATAAASLPVEVSLAAYAGYQAELATFAASLGGAGLSGASVRCGRDGQALVTLGPARLETGRVTCVAGADGAAFLALPLPQSLVRFGRNRLWRLRDDVAAPLPPGVRELLTRRRAGVVRHVPHAAGS